jgi:Domain of unknown function (DUF397)
MEGTSALIWRKSSFSGTNGGQCVEVAASGHVLVRDTKDRTGTVLAFSAETWQTFTNRTKNDAS